MSKPAPTDARGNHYHIVLRGYRRNVLFSTPEDRRALNHFGIKAMRRYGATLHAYCLLPGQFRFLVQMEDRALIDAVKEIVSRYSRHRRRAADVATQLFERPYIAQRVAGEAEFLAVIRSIHLSPVIANEVVEPADYRWSSHRAYLGFKSVAWITTDYGLSLFDADRAQARTAYQRFIAAGLAENVTRHRKTKERTMRALMNEEPSEQIELVGASTCESQPATSSSLASFDLTDRTDRARQFLSIY